MNTAAETKTEFRAHMVKWHASLEGTCKRLQAKKLEAKKLEAKKLSIKDAEHHHPCQQCSLAFQTASRMASDFTMRIWSNVRLQPNCNAEDLATLTVQHVHAHVTRIAMCVAPGIAAACVPASKILKQNVHAKSCATVYTLYSPFLIVTTLHFRELIYNRPSLRNRNFSKE
jgi:hypothetical protein